jgi:hypothetical protein
VELDGDVPQYGSWLPVTDEETGQEAWLTAPSELRSALVGEEISAGERFEIVTMQKRGTDQSDPYQVELEFPDRQSVPETQSGLNEVES